MSRNQVLEQVGSAALTDELAAARSQSTGCSASVSSSPTMVSRRC